MTYFQSLFEFQLYYFPGMAERLICRLMDWEPWKYRLEDEWRQMRREFAMASGVTKTLIGKKMADKCGCLEMRPLAVIEVDDNWDCVRCGRSWSKPTAQFEARIREGRKPPDLTDELVNPTSPLCPWGWFS